MVLYNIKHALSVTAQDIMPIPFPVSISCSFLPPCSEMSRLLKLLKKIKSMAYCLFTLIDWLANCLRAKINFLSDIAELWIFNLSLFRKSILDRDIFRGE